jgi:hypothetical protein
LTKPALHLPNSRNCNQQTHQDRDQIPGADTSRNLAKPSCE